LVARPLTAPVATSPGRRPRSWYPAPLAAMWQHRRLAAVLSRL